MSIISPLVLIAIVGAFVWLITTFIPMSETFKRLIIGVAVVSVVLFFLRAFGLLDGLHRFRI